MSKNDLIIKKPSAMIQTNAKGLTLTQRKFINALINVAQREGDKPIYKIPLGALKDICRISTESHQEVKAQIRALRGKEIEYNILGKDKVIRWVNTPLLGGVSIPGASGVLEFEIPYFIREQILNPEIYAPLDIILIAGFSCVYTIVLYEFLRDYLDSPRVPGLSIEDFRNLMGIEEEKYSHFKDLRRRVIDTAVNEINEKTDLICEYELIKAGGNRYSRIQFSVHRQSRKELPEVTEIPADIIRLLPVERQRESVLNVIRKHLQAGVAHDVLASNIRYSVKMAKTNFRVYLEKAIADDYAAEEREEAARRRTALEQEELLRLKAQREAAEQENLGETLYNQLAPADLLRYTDQVRIEFKTSGVSSQFITEPVIKAKIVEKLMTEREAALAGVQEDLFVGS